MNYPCNQLDHTCWCNANQIWVYLASLESDGLLPCTKRCLNMWSGHAPLKLKSESNKDKSNYFEWLCMRVPFSCFLRGFYRTDDTIVIALTMHSCISCDDDFHQSRNQNLARESTPSSLCGLGNHTKQEPPTGVFCGLSSKSLRPCS